MTIPNQNDFLDAALAYAGRGWQVIPLHSIHGDCCTCQKPDCGAPGKHPRTQNGQKDGTTEESQIRIWWHRWPDANIGICTGTDSGIWMLGPDGEEGIGDFALLQDDHGDVPDTPTARSGSGGQHYVFRHPGGTIKNRQNHLGTKIDVRGDGGYFVAAPSVNINGPYRWSNDPTISAADAPPWLLDWVRQDREEPQQSPLPPLYNPSSSAPDAYTRAIAYVQAMPEAISGQGGHDAAFRVARACYTGFGLSIEETFQILRDVYNPRCQPPWNEKELRHKAESAATTPSDHHRGHLLQKTETDRSRCDTSRSKLPRTGPTTTAGEPGFEFQSLEHMKARPVKWAVPGRIPRGTLTLVAGYGGGGKSTLLRSYIARITTGRPAFGLDYTPAPPGNVLLVAAEDDYETTVVPHLIAEGADLSRVSQVFHIHTDSTARKTRVHLRPEHVLELREYLKSLPEMPHSLIIDPVASFAGRGGINEAKATDVRSVLDPLSDLALDTGLAVIVIAHFNKSSGNSAANRISGSRAYVDAVRLAYCIECDPEDPYRRLLMPVKTNLFGVNKNAAVFGLQPVAPECLAALRTQPALEQLSDEDFRALAEHLTEVRFGTDLEVNADDIVNGSKVSGTKLDKCVEWLRQFLRELAYPSLEVEAEAAKQKYSLDCLKRAKKVLKDEGLRHEKDGTGGWWCGFGPPALWKRRAEPQSSLATQSDPFVLSLASASSSSSASSSCSNSSPSCSISLFKERKEEQEQEGQEVEEGEQVEELERVHQSRSVTEHLADETGLRHHRGGSRKRTPKPSETTGPSGT